MLTTPALAHNKIAVLHPITRLIVGGAQENTMLTAERLGQQPPFADHYDLAVVSGPQTGSEGSLIEELRARGVALTILPDLLRELSPAHDLRALLALRRLMRGPNGQPRWQIVHTHSSKAGLLGRLAARWAGVPLIVHTVHGWSFHERMSPRRRRFYVALEKVGMRLSDATIVVSPRDIDKGLAEGIGQRDDYTLIRSGIELERFGHPQRPPATVRAELGIPAEALVVGSVTRLSPQKAPLDLVAAFAALHHHHPDAWFVVVGDGPLRGAVEAALHGAGIAGRTVLTGLRRDVPELMAAFDLFALSSLWEGLPRVLPQAMATGLPIVCTAADGSAEAVEEGHNGFLVPPGQPAALAAKLATLLGDGPLRARMGEAGQQRAPAFGASQMVQEIHALYQRLLQGTTRQP